MTNYSRSVLKSNGLRHSKNPPVRFSFSLKIVPATIAKKLPLQLRPKPLFIAFFSLSHKRPTFAFTVESGYTLAFANRIAHSGSQGETGVLWMGALSLPSDRFARSGNPAWPGGRTANFAALGSWPGALPKNAESLRNSDALMRVAVPRRRGPAGLRDLFCFCRNCGLYTLHSWPFRVYEARDGITTLGALCVFSKRRTAACQKG